MDSFAKAVSEIGRNMPDGAAMKLEAQGALDTLQARSNAAAEAAAAARAKEEEEERLRLRRRRLRRRAVA